MKRKPISRDEVFRICDEFSQKNEKITNKKIRDKIGGNDGTIGRYVKEWTVSKSNDKISNEKIKKLRRQRRNASEMQPPIGPFFGTDFRDRERRPEYIQKLFGRIGGFWEIYFYALSYADQHWVQRGLIHIKKINSTYQIFECENTTYHYEFTGSGFQIGTANTGSYLYFLLQNQKEVPEVLCFCLRIPETIFDPLENVSLTLYGIAIGLSMIRIPETPIYPGAVKTVFKYLGKDEEAVRKQYQKEYGISDAHLSFNEFCDKHIRKLITVEEIRTYKYGDVLLRMISNEVPHSAVPFILGARP